jgi:hypothetical protein
MRVAFAGATAAGATVAFLLAELLAHGQSVFNTGKQTLPAGATISMSNVIGLVNELALRPAKGPGYSPGFAACINSQGQIDAVPGAATDCVLVDGTSGPCGTGGGGGGGAVPNFADQETPAGTIDGSNATFTLAHAASPGASLELFRNGMMQKGGGFDYSLAGSTVVFASASIPQSGDTLAAWYRY